MLNFGNTRITSGYGEVDLMAPLGSSMPGYFGDRKASGVVDPLLVKAIYLESGKTAGAIVMLDLIGFGATEVAACRKAIHKATGVPAGHIWIHATHTHTGAMVSRDFTSDAESIAPGIYVGEAREDWVASLPDRLAAAVKSARERAKVGSARLGQAKVDGVAFYRRFKMKDGTVKTNPGTRNPEIVAPAGEIDPTLTVIQFPESKSLIAIYGVHPDVVGGTQYSADYPASVARKVAEGLGPDWKTLYLNAACGNINHIDVTNPKQGHGIAESRRIGEAIGAGVLRALDSSEALTVEALAFASRNVPSRIRVVPEDVVKEAERLLKDDPAKARSFNGLFAPAALVLGRTKDREQVAEISAMRLGPVGLVGMPGEIFVELAREVQHDSPFEPTRLIGLTNGSLGYIPHEAAFAEGGYETGYRSARFEPKTGHRWAETAVKLLKSMA